MTKTFTRPAQLIKPFHRFTPAYANGLGSVGGKYIQRKEKTNLPTKQTQIPKAKKAKEQSKDSSLSTGSS